MVLAPDFKTNQHSMGGVCIMSAIFTYKVISWHPFKAGSVWKSKSLNKSHLKDPGTHD